MATDKQRQAARKAAKAAKQQGSLSKIEPKTRQELYDEAKRRGIKGRSTMGRDELARALGTS